MSSKACLISCSDHYSHRMYLWDSCLKKLGYETQYVTSNFDHSTKQVFTCKVPDSVQLSVRPYQKNLSLDRVLSHRMFAKAAMEHVKDTAPDIIVALLPPNYLAKYLASYKRKHPETTLIFDIFDLWPETFPSSTAKKLLAPVFSVWAGLRDRNLPDADFVTTECDLFRKLLGLKEENSATLYLCAQPTPVSPAPTLRDDALELCYLGSINNVISIPDICELICRLVKKKPVTLHIIGKGEREQELIDRARAAGASVEFYGAVYDPVKKQQIMDRCHFGLNIMKSSVCVGLTMKSVDYFRHNLPIINSIPADTAALVEKAGVGVQLDDGCARKILSLSAADCMKMRSQVSATFDRYFAEDIAADRLCGILTKLIR